VRYEHSFSERISIDRESVILNGNLDLTRGFISNGVIAPTVAKLELVGLAAKRLPEDLMPEADSKHRHLTQELLNRLNDVA
jgi:hypothetical protein